jgi:type II secretory pathway predicted ATPase ExeA
MYEAYFGLRERPFSKTPDPRFLFLSHGHREALARMQYAVDERDLLLLPGEIGWGKTTLSRALMDTLDESFKVICLINPRLTPLEFLSSLARHLGVESTVRYKVDLLEEIGRVLFEYYENGITPVVVIDEAQLVPHKETFDEIRLLTNFQLDDRNLVSIVLMGQPELKRRLRHRAYEPLRQRIGMQYDLQPLNLKETAEYLDFRITRAGGRPGLFSVAATDSVYAYSGGIPRIINHAASLALLECFGRGDEQVDEGVMAAVMLELDNNSLPQDRG